MVASLIANGYVISSLYLSLSLSIYTRIRHVYNMYVYIYKCMYNCLLDCLFRSHLHPPYSLALLLFCEGREMLDALGLCRVAVMTAAGVVVTLHQYEAKSLECTVINEPGFGRRREQSREKGSFS